MATKQEVIDYLLSINDKKEVRELWSILAQRSKQLEQNETLKFNVGDKVKWNSKRGYEIQGIIEQINRQTISVKTETEGRWKVSPTFLQKVA